jgi:hypothetical protein
VQRSDVLRHEGMSRLIPPTYGNLHSSLSEDTHSTTIGSPSSALPMFILTDLKKTVQLI